MDENQSNDRAKEIQELYQFVAKQVTAGLFKSEILEKLIELGVERLLALDLLAEMERRLTNLRKRVILLAMSAGEAREAIRKEFWIFGYEVVLVDALPMLTEKLEARVPDLIVTDVFDPQMKGREVLEALRCDIVGRSIPVFVLSSAEMDEPAFRRWEKIKVFLRPCEPEALVRAAKELFLRKFEGAG